MLLGQQSPPYHAYCDIALDENVKPFKTLSSASDLTPFPVQTGV